MLVVYPISALTLLIWWHWHKAACTTLLLSKVFFRSKWKNEVEGEPVNPGSHGKCLLKLRVSCLTSPVSLCHCQTSTLVQFPPDSLNGIRSFFYHAHPTALKYYHICMAIMLKLLQKSKHWHFTWTSAITSTFATTEFLFYWLLTDAHSTPWSGTVLKKAAHNSVTLKRGCNSHWRIHKMQNIYLCKEFTTHTCTFSCVTNTYCATCTRVPTLPGKCCSFCITKLYKFIYNQTFQDLESLWNWVWSWKFLIFYLWFKLTNMHSAELQFFSLKRILK